MSHSKNFVLDFDENNNQQSAGSDIIWDDEDCDPPVWSEKDLEILRSSDYAYGHSLSIGKSARRLQQQSRHEILNYLRSIDVDSQFVHESIQAIRDIPGYGDYPVFANLRNGLWYVSPNILDGTCYFKSADGHAGQWSFSYTRLNLNIATAAAMYGGCILVDSTRRGKVFPDSFTTTVPLWCTVINRLLGTCNDSNKNWNSKFHFPSWLSPLEAYEIERKIPQFISGLGDAKGMVCNQLLSKLKLPLKPVWIAPSMPICLSQDLIKLHIPVICISASKAYIDEKDRHRQSWHYIQGAGDDEESWSQGLTPSAFWANKNALLNAETSDEARIIATTIMSSCEDGIPTVIKSSPEVHISLGKTGLFLCSLSYILPRINDCTNYSRTSIVNLSCFAMPYASNLLQFSTPISSREHWQEVILPSALEFIAKEICDGKDVWICCNSGGDISVAICVAAMVAFHLDENSTDVISSPNRLLVRTEAITKGLIREKLLKIQGWAGESRPSRRYMKELNLFFMSDRGGWSIKNGVQDRLFSI